MTDSVVTDLSPCPCVVYVTVVGAVCSLSATNWEDHALTTTSQAVREKCLILHAPDSSEP